MHLKIRQREVGNFNWAEPQEKSFSFVAVIEDDKGNTVKDTSRENSAVLRYKDSFEPEEKKSNFPKDAIGLLEDKHYVIDECLDFIKGIISTTDYRGDLVTFVETLVANYSKIYANACDSQLERLYKEKEEIEKRIKQIEIDKENVCEEDAGFERGYEIESLETIVNKVSKDLERRVETRSEWIKEERQNTERALKWAEQRDKACEHLKRLKESFKDCDLQT